MNLGDWRKKATNVFKRYPYAFIKCDRCDNSIHLFHNFCSKCGRRNGMNNQQVQYYLFMMGYENTDYKPVFNANGLARY